MFRSNPCSLSVLWSRVVSKNIHTVNGELCCHQEHNNRGLLSSSAPHLLLMKVWQISVKEVKILWERWYSLLAWLVKLGKTDQVWDTSRSSAAAARFWASAQTNLGNLGFCRHRSSESIVLRLRADFAQQLFIFNLWRLSIRCLSNISRWISKEIVNLQWQGQGVTVQDGFFPCKWASTSLLTAKEYFLLA